MNPVTGHARLQSEQIGRATVIRLLDRRLSGHIAVQQLGEEMGRIIDQHDSELVVVNFDRVEILSSVMIGKLIEFKNRVSERSGRLVLTNMSRQVRDVLCITRIDRLFDVQDDEADGLALL